MLKKSSLATILIASLVTMNSHAQADLSCTYKVLANWGSGSQVTFKITNQSEAPLIDWDMQISYPSEFTLAHSWTVAAEGINPISFSNLPGNVLQPGESSSYHFGYQVNHNGAEFSVPTVDSCGEEQNAGSKELASAEIGAEGGAIDGGILGVFVPENVLTDSTTVGLSTTSTPEIAEIFDESAQLFRSSVRSSNEFRISTGNIQPTDDTIQVDVSVPNELLAGMQPGDGIEVFLGYEQGGLASEPFVIFDIVESSLDQSTSTLRFNLPGSSFINSELTDGEYQAIIILAATPGENLESLDVDMVSALDQVTSFSSAAPLSFDIAATVTSAGQCAAASISCPVSGGCVVTSPFLPARVNPVDGVTRPHTGVDYVAPTGTPILAASDGVIERSYTSSSYGETVVIRHTDGSATLYAHLDTRNVLDGAQVSVGDQIGNAGSTGRSSGPHLHFEYVPNGQIFGSKQRIDPDACIDALASGSVTVSDSGSLADDAFSVEIDGFLIGQTTIGGANTLAISNLRPGTHTLALTVITAPDNVGTYTVVLNDGLTFVAGGTSQTGSAGQGVTLSWEFNVPTPTP